MEIASTYPEKFEALGLSICNRAHGYSRCANILHFSRFYVCYLVIFSLLWDSIVEVQSKEAHPKHSIWSLIFLRHYCADSMLSALVKADSKTIRKWVRVVIIYISEMKTVISILTILY